MSRKRVKAIVKYRRDGRRCAMRARVPVEIKNFLGAELNDRLVFEEGSDESVAHARQHSRGYFVVYLAPKVKKAPAQESTHEDAALIIPETIVDESQAPLSIDSTEQLSEAEGLQSLEEAVRRKIQGGGDING